MALGARLKEALTVFAALIVSVQLFVPVQSPDHPSKIDIRFGVAYRIISVPVTIDFGGHAFPNIHDISPLTDPPPVPTKYNASGATLSKAEQLASVPLFIPVQFQLQGPVPVTAVAVPALQKLVVGAMVNAPPLLEPQLPLITTGEKEAMTVPEICAAAL